MVAVVLSTASGVVAQPLGVRGESEESKESMESMESKAPEGPSFWFWTGDLRVRGDWLSRGGAPGESRGRISVRPGVIWAASESLELGAAVRASAATQDAIPGTDNEEADGIRLDQAFLRWLPSSRSTLTVGKAENQLWLTPMVWDLDLRPVGVAYSHERGVRAFDSIRLVAALYEGDHRFEDESRIAAVQAAWSIRQGAAYGGELAVAFLHFDDLERLTSSPLVRTNRVARGRLQSDFELVDLQAAARVPLARGALEARVNHVVNLGADRDDRATRFSLNWAPESDSARFEGGLAYQRIQRDAVVGAFNSDDWWFHSAVRGANAWLGFRPRRDLAIRLSGFSERADDRTVRFERLLLDLELVW